MERIETETEVHRFQKAIKHQLNIARTGGDILFSDSKVHIYIAPNVLHAAGGQLCIALMVNLLARMKTAVTEVAMHIPPGVPVQKPVPLQGNDLRHGLSQLVQSINGPESKYAVQFNFDGIMRNPTVTVSIGASDSTINAANIRVEANAWTAYINASRPRADWNPELPFGSHIAATLATAEIFKHLLLHNFPQQTAQLQIKLLDDTEFCALTYGRDPGENQHPVIDGTLHLDNVAIAGVGAGGSAALYTLSCLQSLAGEITLIDPGCHKQSNLSRYMLSTYDDCHNRTLKSDRAYDFLKERHPLVDIQKEPLPYADVVDRNFRLVVSTVDTPEARWDIQQDWPSVILDAAVVESIYAVLRVYPGTGLCLGCKHPYDPEATWKRRASMWGKSLDEVRLLALERALVSQSDIEQLAYVQNQPIERFAELVGMPFDRVPAITECGDTRFNLQVPNQAATIPFVTTMAGVLIASEIVKDHIARATVLNNWFEHNMFWEPKLNRYRFRPRVSSCQICRNEALR